VAEISTGTLFLKNLAFSPRVLTADLLGEHALDKMDTLSTLIVF
jgi:hypothetical protein